MFADLCTSWEAFDLLPTLDPRVALHWIMPGDVPTCVRWPLTLPVSGCIDRGRRHVLRRWGSPDAQKAVALARERVWRRPANASNARVMKAGHLVRFPYLVRSTLGNADRSFVISLLADPAGGARGIRYGMHIGLPRRIADCSGYCSG